MAMLAEYLSEEELALVNDAISKLDSRLTVENCEELYGVLKKVTSKLTPYFNLYKLNQEQNEQFALLLIMQKKWPVPAYFNEDGSNYSSGTALMLKKIVFEMKYSRKRRSLITRLKRWLYLR